MSRMKRLAVQQLDVSKDYLVIGLDLAKTDTAVIAITTDGELYPELPEHSSGIFSF